MLDTSHSLSFTTQFSRILLVLLFDDVTLSPWSSFYGGLGAEEWWVEWGGEMLHLHPYYIMQFLHFLSDLFPRTWETYPKPPKIITYIKETYKTFLKTWNFCAKLGLWKKLYLRKILRTECVVYLPVESYLSFVTMALNEFTVHLHRCE
jgi:hypothetical protein